MINNWLSTLDAQLRYFGMCFVHFCETFDRIIHNILIKKLLSLGVREFLVPWLLQNLKELIRGTAELEQMNGPFPN